MQNFFSHLIFMILILILSVIMMSSGSNVIKYLIVFLCLCYASWSFIRQKSGTRKTSLILSALVFAFFADYFLIFTLLAEAGLILFILFQFSILLYLYPSKIFFPTICMLAFITISVSLLLSLPKTPVIYLSVYYGSLSLFNLSGYLSAYAKSSRISGIRLILIGIFLLFLCDIHVAVWNLGRSYPVLSDAVYNWSKFAGTLIWPFYILSLVCLVFSLQENTTV